MKVAATESLARATSREKRLRAELAALQAKRSVLVMDAEEGEDAEQAALKVAEADITRVTEALDRLEVVKAEAAKRVEGERRAEDRALVRELDEVYARLKAENKQRAEQASLALAAASEAVLQQQLAEVRFREVAAAGATLTGDRSRYATTGSWFREFDLRKWAQREVADLRQKLRIRARAEGQPSWRALLNQVNERRASMPLQIVEEPADAESVPLEG